MTDDNIKARGYQIDLARIKRDIAETASRHGFAELALAIEWPDAGAGDQPNVNFSGSLFG